MAEELQHRGMDATGFAIMQEDGTICTWKIAYPAWKAVSLPDFHNWADQSLGPQTQILLVHTRAYTKGTPHNNENNHPLYTEQKAGVSLEGVIVHNGMVRNDDNLFESNKKLLAFQRSCATDSDVFRAVLDNYHKVDKGLIAHMRAVEGTAAVAGFHHNSPGKLFLLRDSNPLVLGATSDMLGFASTKEALHKVLKPWIKLHNVPVQVHAPNLSFVAMPDQTGYIFGPGGLEAHDEFKCNGRGTGGYIKYDKRTNYWIKQESAASAKTYEKRFAGINPTVKGTAQGRVTTLVQEDGGSPSASKIHNGTLIGRTLADKLANRSAGRGGTMDPRLFEYCICPNEKCSKHVELSEQDRLLDSVALLACGSCGANLAGAQDASLAVN